MQNARRMVLVDERLLDSNPILQHFQNKQDQSWKQPTEESVKTTISKGLKATLDDSTVPDDVKAKRYSHDLNRFLQTKRKLPDAPLVDVTPTVDELLDLKTETPSPEKPKKKKKKKIRKSVKLQKERTGSRAKKKPQRYADIDWERW